MRSQLIGGIANAYYSLLMLDRQVSVTEQNVALMKETVRTMEAVSYTHLLRATPDSIAAVSTAMETSVIKRGSTCLLYTSRCV